MKINKIQIQNLYLLEILFFQKFTIIEHIVNILNEPNFLLAIKYEYIYS